MLERRVESNARSEAQPGGESGEPAKAAGTAAWPRRAALRAVAGLGIALPLSSAGCGTSAAKSGEAGIAPRTGTAAPSRSSAATSTASASPAANATTSATATARPVALPTASGGGAVEVAHAKTATDAVALTFHGSGSPALADALLTEAEKAGAQVTVMAVGTWLEAYPQMAKRVLDGGHELGNHTEHHINIGAMSPNAAYAEIEACAARLRQLTGSQGRWFRPSRAQHATAQVRAAAARAGYLDVLSYDVDPLDYTDPGQAAVVRNVLGVVAPGDVVSLHLGHRGTVEALPAILDGLHARGLRAVTADELFSAPAGPVRPAAPSQEAGTQ